MDGNRARKRQSPPSGTSSSHHPRPKRPRVIDGPVHSGHDKFSSTQQRKRPAKQPTSKGHYHLQKRRHYNNDVRFSDSQTSYRDNPIRVVHRICSQFERFEEDICCYNYRNDEKMIELVSVLSQVVKADKSQCQRKLTRIFDLLLSERSLRGFFFSLTLFVRRIPMEGDEDRRINIPCILEGIISLLDALLDWDAITAANNLPVDVCIGTTKQLSLQSHCYQEINEKAQRLVQKRNKICSDIYLSRVKNSQSGESSIALPSPEELHNVPQIKENIVDGPFPSTDDYLKIQCSLLREDFINPLRSAICEKPQNNRKYNTLKFTNVRFDEGQTITSSGVSGHKISFKPSRKVKNWSRCKALKYGALVCLSDDNFRTVLYATVVEREVDDLKKGILTVQLQEYNASVLSTLNSREFMMVESPGYFKAYAPVIEKLNEITPEAVPFSQYLVQLHSAIDIPAYLRDKRVIYNMKGVVCDCIKETCPHSQVNMLDLPSWQSMNTPLLDNSQKNALYLALMNELALIQGPPGTGKTYIGLKMVKALLQNSYFWKHKAQGTCPIVVVCYTNHALDQFLEEIIDLELPNTQIIRVGEQSKSEKIKQFSLRQTVYKECRLRRRRHYNPKKSLQTTSIQIRALNEFITGNFVSGHCHFYYKFLSEDVLFELQLHCDIKLSFPDLLSESLSLASWLDEDIRLKVESFKQSRDEDDFRYMNEDRCDDLEKRNLNVILREEGLQTFIRMFGTVSPMSKENSVKLLQIGDRLPRGREKLQLFKYCLKNLLEALQKQQELTVEEQRVYDSQMEEIRLECLQKANVVGLTTTVAARDNELMSQVESKILIVEEAAEVLEPQLIATLTMHTKHLILIGDHQQLRPKTNDYTIGHNYKLEISMFERLVRNRLPHATLAVQHRMRPEISQIVSDHIYQKKLQDHESTKKYENVRGMKHNMYFINHDKEETPEDIDPTNHSNVHEAAFLASLCKYFLQQEYKPDQITVITPYVGQFFELRSQFKEKGISEVKITTIDGYQGEENDIILLSLVRSNRKGQAGFVKEENRICVALSRAKCGLYCIGNFSLFQKCSPLWSSIVEDLKTKNLLGDKLQLYCARHEVEIEVSSTDDFAKAPDGGCSRPCEERYKLCNHVCKRKCHPDDRNHTSPCPHPCPKRCPADLHWCQRLCSEDCGDCREKVNKIIPACKHKQLVPCYKPPENFLCKAHCEKSLPCGHPCNKKCGEQCSTSCKHKVQRELICGHKAEVECRLTEAQAAKECAYPCSEKLACGHQCSGNCGKCRQGRLHVSCKKTCTRKLPCGHKCSNKCFEICGQCKEKCAYSCEHGWCGNKCRDACKSCTHRCEWKCRHKRCTRMCGEICNREKCDKPCTKKLKECGHPCLGLCGETCPPVCHKCGTVETNVHKIFSHEQCHEPSAGHRYIVLEDCPHVFSVKSLDRWMEGEQGGREGRVCKGREEGEQEGRQHSLNRPQVVDWKRCPLCKTPVMSTLRYANIAKQVLHNMNELKTKQDSFLKSKARQLMLEEISIIPNQELKSIGLDVTPIREEDKDVTLQKKYVCYLSAVDVFQAKKELTELMKLCDKDLTDCDEDLVECAAKEAKTETDIDILKLLLSQASDFLTWVKNRKSLSKLSEQMILDIISETRRFTLLKKYYTMKYDHKQEDLMTDINLQTRADLDLDEDEKLLMKILSNETISNDVDGDQEVKIEVLKNVISHPWRHIPLTPLEKQNVLSTCGAHVQLTDQVWYKCPKGHYYCNSSPRLCEHIGDDCANKCPECQWHSCAL